MLFGGGSGRSRLKTKKSFPKDHKKIRAAVIVVEPHTYGIISFYQHKVEAAAVVLDSRLQPSARRNVVNNIVVVVNVCAASFIFKRNRYRLPNIILKQRSARPAAIA